MDGKRLAAFPAPAVLRDLDTVQGVAERKLPWLHAIADAALDGTLDGAHLRSLEPSEALV